MDNFQTENCWYKVDNIISKIGILCSTNLLQNVSK